MGVLPKNRKRKFNKIGAQNPNNNKVNDEEMIKVTNENDVTKAKTKKAKKNKISVMPVESKNDNDISEVKAKKNKIVVLPEEDKTVKNEEDNMIAAKKVKKNELVESSGNAGGQGITEEMMARYPILKDEEMIKKFQSVTLTNNKKGCLRQSLRQQLKGTSDALLPDAINTKIQAILKIENPNFMKLRILFNMLKTALQGTKTPAKKEKPVKKDKKQKQKKDGTEDENDNDKKPEQKVKGPKRYVVFIGNLALDISKEKILEHFSDLSDKIKDVRIPKPLQNKKSAIAYLEVADEVSYELALSKHHSMLDNRRINVLYSTQKNSKISKAEAKGKAAKLVAMQKSGQLAGSAPLSKKRSARRKKMKLAQKAQEAAERGV